MPVDTNQRMPGIIVKVFPVRVAPQVDARKSIRRKVVVVGKLINVGIAIGRIENREITDQRGHAGLPIQAGLRVKPPMNPIDRSENRQIDASALGNCHEAAGESGSGCVCWNKREQKNNEEAPGESV